MKKILSLALLAMLATGAQAEEKKDSAASNKPVFTTIKEIPVTSMKDQNRSGTCWDYSTLSYFEAGSNAFPRLTLRRLAEQLQ